MGMDLVDGKLRLIVDSNADTVATCYGAVIEGTSVFQPIRGENTKLRVGGRIGGNCPFSTNDDARYWIDKDYLLRTCGGESACRVRVIAGRVRGSDVGERPGCSSPSRN